MANRPEGSQTSRASDTKETLEGVQRKATQLGAGMEQDKTVIVIIYEKISK